MTRQRREQLETALILAAIVLAAYLVATGRIVWGPVEAEDPEPHRYLF